LVVESRRIGYASTALKVSEIIALGN
jgi:hypothetical protein